MKLFNVKSLHRFLLVGVFFVEFILITSLGYFWYGNLLKGIEKNTYYQVPVVVLKKNEITMTSQGFQPKKLTINTGDTITFLNKDNQAHWPAAGPHDHHDEAYSADNPLLPNKSILFTFFKPGHWEYHDHFYEEQKFDLTVVGNAIKIVQNKPENTVLKNTTPLPSESSTKENCTPRDGHEQGILTSIFDSQGKLIGWGCQMGSHMNCNATPNGIWQTCDFPPDLMMWPDPVPKTALDNPKLYTPPITNY